jgi:crotonobetainyl-CoA:carnitine CoA-transferase CaiB-like acyl-CoA transferase
MGKRPLENIKVLEFTHAVMGPAAGVVLADLGAEVIHIEPIDGDHTRRLKGFGTGYFTYFNRNKKSLAVNLKSPEGHAIICKLLAGADVLIENFAPNTMEKLGLGYENLKDSFPRLIYCSLKGFLKGPYEQRPALDEVVQMMSGLAYMTGPVGQPLRAGASIVDIMGGTYGAMAILVALMERQSTGRGKLVQNGLFETAAYLMGQHMAYSAISQETLPPMPARVSAWSVYRTFTTAEGEQVFIGITSEKHWERFCEVFERPDLAANDSLRSNNQRIAERDWLLPDLEAMFAKLPRAAILQKAEAAGIPFAPIARPEDLFDDPQLNAGNSLFEVTLADGRKTKLPKLPMSIEGNDWELRRNAPAIGEDTLELLVTLGYSQAELDNLLENEIIAASENYQ